MNKKIFMLLALFTLVTVPIMAQTPFQWGEVTYTTIGDTTTVVTTATTTVTDTTTVVTTANETMVIPIYQRTWQTLERQLKTVLKNSNEVEQIENRTVKFAYEVNNIPTKTGKKTLFLCYTQSGKYFTSCENPNDQSILHSCYSAGILQADGALPEKRQTNTIQGQKIRTGW